MIYYATIYLKNGEIHLKPFSTREAAEACISKVEKDNTYGSQIDKAKVVRKNEDSPSFHLCKGYWIS